MTRSVALPLESLTIAEQWARPAVCLICECDNLRDTELCRHCSAPLALAPRVHRKGDAPQMVAVLGSSGVGKSVYLGMLLDMLSRLPDRLPVVARGAYSVSLQQTIAAALARCEFPCRTPPEPEHWNWIHCEARLPHKQQPMELVIPDMSGETLLREIDHAHSFLVVRSLLQKATGALLLLDAHHLRQAALEEEFYGMKLLTYLKELTPDAKRGWPTRPLAIVFTKADQCADCFDDPAAFARRHTPGLWRLCRERFGQHAFFAVSVAGACAHRRSGTGGRHESIPLRVEPRGIVEPFEWLVRQLDARKKQPK